MAITTIDGAIAGMQPSRMFYKSAIPTNLVIGRPYSLWSFAGIPGAGTYDGTLNGVTLSSTSALVDGQLPFYDPAGGVNSYLARLVAVASGNVGYVLLCDRLWHNGGFAAVNTAQAITSPTWPARDNAGATAGDGVLLGVEYGAAGAANAPVITVSYTNSAGVAGRTGTNAFPTAASPTQGSFFPIGLQAGDTGVQSVQSVTFSIAPTVSTAHLVAYRQIAMVDIPLAGASTALDILTSGMPQLFNGTVPFLVVEQGSTNATNVSGSLTVTKG